MFSLIVIILLAFILFAYAAIPLLFPKQADKLPSERDPLLEDLGEERDALFRAIRELEAREDLKPERRDELRARYEAKAAKVLRAMDERQAQLKGLPKITTTQTTPRRIPYGVLGLLSVMVVSALALNQFVLPRVGENASVTTFFEDDLQLAQQLKDLQEAAEREPNAENLLALGEWYWQQSDAENGKQIYQRIVDEIEPVPGVAYQRLGFATLQEDLNTAKGYLEKARDAEPNNLDTLYTLAEVYFVSGQTEEAVETLEAFVATPEGANDEDVQARLEVFKHIAPASQAAIENPTQENQLALADAYWQVQERERATDVYLNVLTQFGPHNDVALSRVGQTLFFAGRTEDAVGVLEQAQDVNAENLDTLLFLGNAYFSLNRYQEAIDTWENYVAVAGGEDKAGRVPELIKTAKARLVDPNAPIEDGSGETTDASVSSTISEGQRLYAANCAACHGVHAEGGSGPALAGNVRAADRANVQNIITYGRGLMPGFSATLTPGQIEAVTEYVTQELSQQ
jgi:mono/diheme cytochrome c family protein/thioredoxin-like negative regulator of GroEL